MSASIRKLTSRERQVLALLPTGMTNRSLAAELGVAERTIRSHLTHIMRKLGVESRVAAAVLAERHRKLVFAVDDVPDEATPQEATPQEAISRADAHMPES
ncbi:response regulator transcription factor [Streptomyces sparsus]